MRPDAGDPAALWDMQDAGMRVLRYLEGLSSEEFSADDLRKSAVERRFEVIGEAANRVSEEFKTQHPEVNWQDWKNFRNVIAHRYEELKVEYIWQVATQELPVLLQHLDRMIPPPPAS